MTLQHDIQVGTQMQTLTLTHANLMLENMRTGMALYDVQEFRLLSVNNRFKLFLQEYLCPGKSYELALGRPLRELLPQPKEVARSILNIFRTVAETGEAYEIDRFPIPMLGKGLTYWQWTLDPIRDAGGTITHLLHSANDVTEHVRAIQQTEEIYSSLSQTTHTIDAERKRLEVIETVARSVRESFNVENIGQSAIDAIQAAFHPLCVTIHVADTLQRKLRLLHIFTSPEIEHVKDVMQEVSYESELFVAGTHRHKNPVIIENLQAKVQESEVAKDQLATNVGVQGYICIPLWSGEQFEGALTASFRESIHADGAEAKTLEGCGMHIAAALAQARLHAEIEHERVCLRAILDQLPEGILLVEAPHGRIQYINSAATEITGVPPSEQVNRQVQDAPLAPTMADVQGNILPPKALPSIRALQGETINGYEIILTKQDGNEVFLLTSAAPLRKEDGTIIGAIVVFQDITTRKSIEQQKNEFLSITSHELRTPITTIHGFAELLQVRSGETESLSTPRNQRALNSIIDQSKRLSRLIEEILDLSRIESKRMLLNIEPHNLIQTLKQVIENQSIMAKRHTIQLVLDGLTAQDTLTGNFDEDRIFQVLNNLIHNAIKYSPDHTEIEVGLRYTNENPDEALIWVRDHGIGIAPNELPHIYERFHRASNLDRSISGLGIGLYLVNELVTRHGGSIRVESIEGQGSTFYVTLPLRRVHTQ